MDKVAITHAVAEAAWEMVDMAPHPSVRGYWQSVAQTAQELSDGTAEDEADNAFTVYMSIKDDFDLAPQFLEAWGVEIGFMGGAITDITGKLKDSLERRA
jgi:hypothetical protein